LGSEDRLVSAHYGSEVLAEIGALCEKDPGRESCGFVVRRREGLEVAAVPNVADTYHAHDPARFPRTSLDSYLMDPRAQLRILEELEADGGEVVAVWHSHIEVGAYFSAKDRADAVVDGVQQVPGAEYLVFGVSGGRVTEVARYELVGAEFVESVPS
jgi:[CysO sulfur-carrier protein]-S-L-cysteine hydrolase